MRGNVTGALVSAAGAKALDAEAAANWGLDPFALVEAAGRACAQVFCRVYARKKKERFSFAVLAGKGNNAADALVMLKALVLDGYTQSSTCLVVTPQAAAAAASEKTPLSQAMLAVRKMGVPVMKWDAAEAAAITHTLTHYDVIIDGITGTGLSGPLRDTAREMAEAVNAVTEAAEAMTVAAPRVVSIDVPSGSFDGWQPGMPIIAAHATLAIEPQKLCLYAPTVRPYAGDIIPVGGIFPPALMEQYREAELAAWDTAAARIPPVSPSAYKYERGVVEIRAGSPGAAGAARLAAWGAQAAGAGLVRLIVDSSLYPVIAPACSGVMVTCDDGGGNADERFSPNAALLGPGWGRGEDRRRLLEIYLPREKSGLSLILDADAIALAKDMVFNGNVLLTPHPGEFAAYTDLPKEAILSDPIPPLRRFAAKNNVHILLKSHVMYAASPDGRIGIIDGMNPALAAGGSGDLLAGFCGAMAARNAASARYAVTRQEPFDGYACACAAASLLIQAAKSDGVAGAFIDPAELVRPAAAIAGAAWLPAGKV
jgi:NAD(P)H-hydrate epimerase